MFVLVLLLLLRARSLQVKLNLLDRFLNNAQSAADSANFMANVKFDGIDEDLTAPNHPWIYYGVRRPLHYNLQSETHDSDSHP